MTATTVGTETTLGDLLEDLIRLDYDAADAYQAAIYRLDDRPFAMRWQSSSAIICATSRSSATFFPTGAAPRPEGDMKGILAKGKVVIGGLMGDEFILHAMHQRGGIIADERAVQFDALPSNDSRCLAARLEDERRHYQWICGETPKTF